MKGEQSASAAADAYPAYGRQGIIREVIRTKQPRVSSERIHTLQTSSDHPIRLPDGRPKPNARIHAFEIAEQVDLERRMVAALENRLRQIGSELHDGLGQVLTATGLLSQCLEFDLDAENDRAHARTRRLIQLTEKAQHMVRAIQSKLSPGVTLNGHPLDEALEELCREADACSNASCTFVNEWTAALPSRVALHLFRIVREALDNAARHAEARNIVVSMRRNDQDEIEVEVTDDGAGFDVDAVAADSLGLTSMRYAAHVLRGRLQIQSHPKTGTVVRCSVPLRLEAGEENGSLRKYGSP